MNRYGTQLYIGVRRIPLKFFFALGIAALFFCAIMYGFFIQATVRNAMAWERFEKEISSLSSLLGEREAEYMALKRDITPDRAHSLGFKDVTKEKFVTRPTVGGLSFNNEI